MAGVNPILLVSKLRISKTGKEKKYSFQQSIVLKRLKDFGRIKK